MAPPLVSVIVPVYNNAPYLCQCLDSVVNQTLKDIEIVCIDDGSTDESLSIINRYAMGDKRFKVYSQKNKGGGAARNLGVTHASGKYLSFIDSDDFYDETVLKTAYTQAEFHDADVVFFGYKVYYNQTNSVLKFKENSYINNPMLPLRTPFSARDCPNVFINLIGTHVWNKLFKKSLIDENNIRFMETHNSNDVYFSLFSSYCAKRILSLNDAYYYLRRGHNTNIQSTINKSPFDNYYVFLELKDQLSKSDDWEIIKNGFINKALSESIKYLNRFYTNYSTQYHELLTLYVKEGFSNLGITNYPRRLIQNKWDYLQYQEYVKEYTTGRHRIDGKLFKIKGYIYRIFNLSKYLFRSLSRFGIRITINTIYNLLREIVLIKIYL